MKKIESNIFLLLIVVLFSASCSKEASLGEVKVPGSDYVLPQGKESKADAKILDLYKKYNSYFLYDFSEKDFSWELISSGVIGDNVYDYTPIKTEKINDLLDLLDQTWLSFYSDEFLKGTMPYKVLLTDSVKLRVEEFDWSSWSTIFSWKKIPARSIKNQIAVSAIEGGLNNMSAADKRAYKSYLQAVFLIYCYNNGYITIPDDFAQISDYSKDLSWESSTVAREAGFVYNYISDIEWSVNTSILTLSDDVSAYLSALAFRTDEEWAEDLEIDIIKQKYDILISTLKNTFNIDIQKIGNTTFD
jgi:hypothetical protein